MSPCEKLTLGSKGTGTDTTPVSLDDYAVTSNGFLPEQPPLEKLPNPYYAPWESLVASVPSALAEQTLRQQVDRLPILSTDHLATEPEWRRACVILGFLAHAYIWGGDTASEILPPALTVPLLAVSQHHGIPPVATYASLNLWNFRTTCPSHTLTTASTLHALHTFTGTFDESWFYTISVAIEAEGAPLIPLLLSALHTLDALSQPQASQPHVSSHAAHHHSFAAAAASVTHALHTMTSTIHTLGGLLDQMDLHCDPQVFYHRIRPFLAGSKNMAAAGLPRGVFYDEGDGRGAWRQLRGGSNGQSSLVQFLDLVLGVEHAAGAGGRPEGGGGDKKAGGGGVSFHQEVRGYMPEAHRRFLEDVAARYPGGMRKGVEGLMETWTGEGEEVAAAAVQEAFQTATRALAEFRNKHLQMVTRYIIIPSRQPNGSQGVNLATVSSRLKAPSAAGGVQTSGGELTGTGGTALLPFLKQSRDETFQAGRLPVRHAVRVVTFNAKGELAGLYAKRDNFYKPTGGGIGRGEDHETAVKRWFREATGGLIKLHSNVCVAITKEFRNGPQQVSHCYVADLVDDSGEPALTEGEIGDGHSWVSVRRAQRTMTVAEPTSELGRFIKERDIYL